MIYLTIGGLLTCGALATHAQIEEVIEEVIIDHLSDEELWDTAYHTSDEAGEKSTGYEHREQAPKGAVRIGCECMDGEMQDKKGQGACSGHGGVRYWRYRLVSGDLHLMPTDRHLDHPAPLTPAEIRNLSAHNTSTPRGYKYGRRGDMSWTDMVSLLIICLTIAYVARLIWHHDKRPNRGEHREDDPKRW